MITSKPFTDSDTNGKMRRKLLNKTLWLYLSYAIVIVTVASIGFYFFLRNLYSEEVLEHLFHEKTMILKDPSINTTNVAEWNKRNSLFKLIPGEKEIPERFYRAFYLDQNEGEMVPFMVLDSPLRINEKQYTLRLRASLLENEDLIESILLVFTMLLIALLGGIILITQLVSRKLWKPFFQTLEQLETYEINRKTEVTLPNTSTEEFQRLNTTVEELIRKNSIIYNDQRQFIENAAHELQTPIAILSSQLNILSQSEDLTEQQALLIENMEVSNRRFQHLNKNLLLLSKLESDSSEKEPVNLTELLEKYLELLQDAFGLSKITIRQHLEQNVVISANSFALSSLIENLISNALKHNHEGGIIEIELTEKQLIIRNTGTPHPLKTEQLFRRFQPSSATGSGLGLSIVKKISDQHLWTIQYTFQDKQHVFSLLFE